MPASRHGLHLSTSSPHDAAPLGPESVDSVLVIGQGPVLGELPAGIDPVGLREHHVQMPVIAVRRYPREDPAVRIVGQDILADDAHGGVFTRVTADRDDRHLDVVLAQAYRINPDGKFTEYWALADDQGAVDAFWS